MQHSDPVEQLITKLKATPSAKLDARVRNAIDDAKAKREEDPTMGGVWRNFMRTRYTTWATTAMVVLAAIAAVVLLNKSVTAAHAIERAIDAYKSIRYLHVKVFDPVKEQPAEFWIKSDGSGRVEKARYYLPATEDGVKIITWSPEKAEIWFQDKRRYQTFRTKRIEGWMQSLLEQSQPQLVLEKLLKARNAGKIDLRLREPRNDQRAFQIVATHKDAPRKDIYWIDPKTQLIALIERFRVDDGNETFLSRTELSEYNVVIGDEKFSLKAELTPDVRVADQLGEPIGVPQGNMTDEQAATETVRQFFQALVSKDYRKAGLIVGGEVERDAREEYGNINIARIVSVGPAVHQPDWGKRGFKVPCELQIAYEDGGTALWKPHVWVRPGDDEAHPDRWNITGGVNAHETAIRMLPDNKKYEDMSPKEAAQAFLRACAEENWEEFAKFSVQPMSDPNVERIKRVLGGLQIISIGEPWRTNGYPGWYVPYEIKFRPQEVNVRLSNTNSAKRFVLAGFYDNRFNLLQDLKWSGEPLAVSPSDPCSRMSPLEAAKAYFEAQAKLDWNQMRKFTSANDVEATRLQIAEMQKRGLDPSTTMPAWEPMEAFWSQEHSSWFVKCRVTSTKKWNLAIRNDNPARRFMWDGGI